MKKIAMVGDLHGNLTGDAGNGKGAEGLSR